MLLISSGMEVEEEVVIELEAVCRLCLSNEPQLGSIFDSSIDGIQGFSSFAAIISACVGFEISLRDNFPSLICEQCVIEIQRWLAFRTKCQAANDSLLKVVGQSLLNSVQLASGLSDGAETITNSEKEVTSIIPVDNEPLEPFQEEDVTKENILETADASAILYTDDNSQSSDNPTSQTKSGLSDSDDIVNSELREPDCDDEIDEDPTDEECDSNEVSWRQKATKCPLCGKAFGKFSGAKLHLKVVHTVLKIYPCKLCAHLSSTSTYRQIHIEKRHPENTLEKYTCKLCGLYIKHRGSYYRHMKQHKDDKCCKLCDLEFESEEAVTKHNKTSHTIELLTPPGVEEKYHCHLCENTSFWREKDWRAHYLDVHGTQELHPCKVCNRAYRTRALLIIHERSHTGEKPYMCDQCACRFSSKNSLKNHMRKHTSRFQCMECHKTFTSQPNLTHHMRRHTGEKPYICHECGKAFASLTGIQFHARVHSGEMPYSCEKCGFICRALSTLNAHKVTHTEDRPHHCDQCGKSFKLKSWLKIHLKTHLGIKNFVCEICNHAFIARYQLKSHMKTHSGERTHVCDICSKAFARRDTLSEHRRSHTKETRYACEHCEEEFVFLKAFKRHKCYLLPQIGSVYDSSNSHD